MLRGAIAAAVTPLADSGESLDEGAFGPYADFLHTAGLDGVLTLGTNGEGILLDVAERRRVTELFVEASRGRLLVAAHCGAQTTADTVSLAEHAATVGADAVAVIGPPYFKLDAAAQRAHLLAAANACAPLPFYVYEFAATAGYAFEPEMLLRLRDEADNLTGLKVSDTPWEAFERYLLDGLDVFVGPEALIHRGMEAGAVGAVSALASAFPAEVAAVVRNPDRGRGSRSGRDSGQRRGVSPPGRPQARAGTKGRRRGAGRARAASRSHAGRGGPARRLARRRGPVGAGRIRPLQGSRVPGVSPAPVLGLLLARRWRRRRGNLATTVVRAQALRSGRSAGRATHRVVPAATAARSRGFARLAAAPAAAGRSRSVPAAARSPQPRRLSSIRGRRCHSPSVRTAARAPAMPVAPQAPHPHRQARAASPPP